MSTLSGEAWQKDASGFGAVGPAARSVLPYLIRNYLRPAKPFCVVGPEPWLLTAAIFTV